MSSGQYWLTIRAKTAAIQAAARPLPNVAAYSDAFLWSESSRIYREQQSAQAGSIAMSTSADYAFDNRVQPLIIAQLKNRPTTAPEYNRQVLAGVARASHTGWDSIVNSSVNVVLVAAAVVAGASLVAGAPIIGGGATATGGGGAVAGGGQIIGAGAEASTLTSTSMTAAELGGGVVTSGDAAVVAGGVATGGGWSAAATAAATAAGKTAAAVELAKLTQHPSPTPNAPLPVAALPVASKPPLDPMLLALLGVAAFFVF